MSWAHGTDLPLSFRGRGESFPAQPGLGLFHGHEYPHPGMRLGALGLELVQMAAHDRGGAARGEGQTGLGDAGEEVGDVVRLDREVARISTS